MIGFWSTHVDMHFLSSLSCEGFANTCWVTFSAISGIGWIWSTNVEMHFVTSLAWGKVSQHKLRCIFCHCWHDTCLSTLLRFILCPRWHGIGLVNISQLWNIFFVIVGMTPVCHQMLRCIFCPRWRNTCYDTLYVRAAMDRLWPTHIMMHFVSSLEWGAFCQHMFRYILCSRWHGRGLVNSSW